MQACLQAVEGGVGTEANEAALKCVRRALPAALDEIAATLVSTTALPDRMEP